MNSVWAILLFPLFGFLLLSVGSKLPRMAVSVIGAGVVGAAFVAAIWMFFWDYTNNGITRDTVAYVWIVSGNFKVNFGAYIDPLATVMTLVITGVGFLIMVYSIGYMAEEVDYRRFFCYMNLFVFAMLVLVLSDNYLFLLVGWAGVGLTSFLLIGFWYDRPAAVAAAKQALVVNVIGDWGVMVAAFVLFRHFYSLQYTTIFSDAARVLPVDGPTVRIITLLLLVGAVAKSAQLTAPRVAAERHGGPDAGQRLDPCRHHGHRRRLPHRPQLPALPPIAVHLRVVVIIGACGAFFAATCGLTNNDIKRVLAFSTMSQIAYMFVGVGAAAYATGIFHLTTHAYFKALLFMGAGAVMHALHDNVDIRRMGGLKGKMPFTYWTFLIACLSISGIPLFAGFFSKDDIIGAIYNQAQHTAWLWIIWVMLVLTAGLTALYMFRLLFLVFLGESRDPELADHAHDPGLAMRIPMGILAVLAVSADTSPFPTPKTRSVPGSATPLLTTHLPPRPCRPPSGLRSS